MWPENVKFDDDYAFKSSPESCSDNSFSTDIMDVTSDEDFITQLSSELDIPLLLSQGEDEMAVLNSFFDKSPEDFICKINSPPHNEYISKETINTKDLDFLDWGLDPSLKFDQSDNKSEGHSDESSSSSNSLEPSTPPIITSKKINPSVFFATNIAPKKESSSSLDLVATVQVVPQSNASHKVPIKRVPIKPKTPYTPVKDTKNFVYITNEFPNVMPKRSNVIARNGLGSNVVVLDRIPTLPVNTYKGVAPCITTTIAPMKQTFTVPSIMINSNCNIDPKILKRQQRKIKNRESACLSRKKKKDYLNSLEEKINELSTENRRLTEENTYLRERLSLYEIKNKSSYSSISNKGAKPALVLCVFLLVIGINFNFMRNPLSLKTNRSNRFLSDYRPLPDHHGRSLLWTEEGGQNNKNNTYFSPLTMCPASINQTESARLLLELERWIGKPELLRNNPTPIKKPMQSKIRRKKIRVDSSMIQIQNKAHYGPENERKNEIQVFSPKAEQLYSEFLEAINRKDDTFYVVSFSEQHLLLPALSHNKTARPKMSLLMPSVFPNETTFETYVPLMQIDCEVLDTKLVNVKYGAIPRQYRQYGNMTKTNEKMEKERPDNSTSSNLKKKSYKPYFLGQKDLKYEELN